MSKHQQHWRCVLFSWLYKLLRTPLCVPLCLSSIILEGLSIFVPHPPKCYQSHCKALNVFQMKLPKQQHKISIKAHKNRRSKESFLLNHISSIDSSVGSLDFLSLLLNELLTLGWPQHYSGNYSRQSIMVLYPPKMRSFS